MGRHDDISCLTFEPNRFVIVHQVVFFIHEARRQSSIRKSLWLAAEDGHPSIGDESDIQGSMDDKVSLVLHLSAPLPVITKHIRPRRALAIHERIHTGSCAN